MTAMTTNPFLSSLLESTAASLDIPPGKYKEAVERYTAVGNWLDQPGSTFKAYSPSVSVQGSFRLGTVVRPVVHGREADYDIDLVCRLDAPGAGMTPRGLKNLVGDRLKENGNYSRMLDKEGRRCWTLNYAEADGVGFHMDVLPSIRSAPSVIQAATLRGVPRAFAEHAIELAERLAEGRYEWLRGGSNPEGFACWFEAVNREAKARVAPMQKQALFESNRGAFASVQSVPDALIRTPLQRAVQLLKRHRDVRFAGHPLECEKPISVIITTLAGLAYRGEGDVAEAVASILERIDDYAATGVIRRVGGRWIIENPVNPDENFADRWNDEGSRRAEAFFQWVAWARQDLAVADGQSDERATRATLAEAFAVPGGGGMVKSGSVVVVPASAVPAVGAASHCQAPPWPTRQLYRVDVEGSVRRAILAGKELWRLSDRPVQKGFGLRFRASTNAPGPYEVKWQVVNTGPEAARAGAGELRGGFVDGEGVNGTVRWEGTAYTGTHWIEAFVVKDGVCVARSGKVYVRVR